MKPLTETERHCLNLVRISNRVGSHVGCVRIGSESREHFIKKAEVCFDLKKRGHLFVSEGIFKDGQRADIIDLTEGYIYEILKSETDIMLKKKSYPLKIKAIKIK